MVAHAQATVSVCSPRERCVAFHLFALTPCYTSGTDGNSCQFVHVYVKLITPEMVQDRFSTG